MKIRNILAVKEKVFSFEFFPPKTAAGEENLFKAISELKPLAPDFVSVTYGALGSNQDKSLAIIEKIHNEIGLEVMAHYTCVGGSKVKVNTFLDKIKSIGVDNILALRGDAPIGMNIKKVLESSPFRYACDLTEFIKSGTHDFSVGVAGYPEGHPECVSLDHDLRNLKRKVDAGADFIITQLFFDNSDFYRFRDKAYLAGIAVPIIPGIMPIESFKQIEKITSMCGTHIPQKIRQIFTDKNKTEEEKLTFGLDFTTKQCEGLLKNGVKGLHFYTLNKSTATREIFKRLDPERESAKHNDL
jgi:methylenetetrahydrofolate reductase (NADPH)